VLWSATGTLHSEAETPGPRMHGPIDHLPFIVFHYPPAYHLASRAVMALGVGKRDLMAACEPAFD
jgi:hypothetical protein